MNREKISTRDLLFHSVACSTSSYNLQTEQIVLYFTVENIFRIIGYLYEATLKTRRMPICQV